MSCACTSIDNSSPNDDCEFKVIFSKMNKVVL